MATITLSLSTRTNKDTGKAEILLRYRNTREVALRAHTHVLLNLRIKNSSENIGMSEYFNNFNVSEHVGDLS